MGNILSTVLDRPIAFHRCFIDLGIGINGAIMLSQAIYWSSRTNNDEGWFYKVRDEWTEETGLSRKQQESSRKKMTQLGFWHEVKHGLPAKLYYRIDFEVLNKLLTELHESKQTSGSRISSKYGMKGSTEMVQKEPSVARESSQLYTETTTEITSENTYLLKEKKQKKNNQSVKEEDVSEIFEHWKRVTGSQKARMTGKHDKRYKKIVERMKNYSKYELMDAISGVMLSTFHVENGHLGISTIFRDDEQVDKFLAIRRSGAKSTSNKSAFAKNQSAVAKFLGKDDDSF